VVGTPDVDALSTSLVTALQRHGLAEPKIAIRVVEEIPRHHASGKLQRFIALRAPAG
jgi:phenylacetate-CoA ligase